MGSRAESVQDVLRGMEAPFGDHRNGKARCKILAITDKSLARAILDNLDGDFTEWEAK